jgi:hypothetical protein
VQLREEGATAEQIRASGYSAMEIWDGGYNWQEVKVAGFSDEELKEAKIGGFVHSHTQVLDGIEENWFGEGFGEQDETRPSTNSI